MAITPSPGAGTRLTRARTGLSARRTDARPSPVDGYTRRATLCWGALALSIAAYAAVTLFVAHQPLQVGSRRLRFFDLRVFRDAAGAVLHHQPLYDVGAYHGLALHFTYPPFAALMLAPTQLWALSTDAVLSCGLNLALLLGLLRLTPRLWPTDASTRRECSWAVAALLTAVLMWCEPVSVTLGYGQVDLVIALLVVWDLGRARGSTMRGFGIGLAAALKLTPLIFIPYLLLTGQRRSALTATWTFLAAAALSFAVLPADSARYWSGLVLDASRAGDLADAANQAVMGSLTRFDHTQHVGEWGMVVLAAVALAGLGVAVQAGRRGDYGVGFAVCAITSLLVSPVSWTHHWVLAIPAVPALVVWGRERRAWGVLGSAVALAVISFTYLPELMMGSTGDLHLSMAGQLLAAPYVILGLAIVVCVAVHHGLRTHPARRATGWLAAPRPSLAQLPRYCTTAATRR